MTPTRRRLMLFYGVLILLLLATDLARRELAIARGERVLMALAPVDPRSLLQGDYMRLDYVLARELRAAGERRSPIVIRLDKQGVAHWQPKGDPNRLAADERRLTLWLHQETHIGPDAYFFEEGSGDRLAQAHFGEFRLAKDGSVLLVGLTDQQGTPLGKRRARW